MVFIGAMVVQKESVREVVDAMPAHGQNHGGRRPAFHELCGRITRRSIISCSMRLKSHYRCSSRTLRPGTRADIYTTEEKPDITTTPLPRWDLINMKYYASMSVQYSRGCPFDCEFCDIVNLNGRKPRVKSNDQMIREFATALRSWLAGTPLHS